MTFTHWLLVLSHAIAIGAGWYGHYRFGAQVAADIQKVKSVI